MNLTDDDTLKWQCGVPIFLDDICAVYPATLRQIVEEGYDNFQKYLGIITANKPIPNPKDDSEFKQLLTELTYFQYLLMMTAIEQEVHQTLKAAFQFFIHEEVVFSLDPAQIVIGPLDEKHLLTEEKFYDLQQIIKRMYFLEIEGEEIIIHADDSPAVKRLKMLLMHIICLLQ